MLTVDDAHALDRLARRQAQAWEEEFQRLYAAQTKRPAAEVQPASMPANPVPAPRSGGPNRSE